MFWKKVINVFGKNSGRVIRSKVSVRDRNKLLNSGTAVQMQTPWINLVPFADQLKP